VPRIEGAGASVVREYIEADEAKALLPRPFLYCLHQPRCDTLTLGSFRDGKDRDIGAGLERDRVGRGLHMHEAKTAARRIIGNEGSGLACWPREGGVHVTMLEAEDIALRMPRQIGDGGQNAGPGRT
jgi:hypothetical protein